MAILHGNWIKDSQKQTEYLFIWGESWKPSTSEPKNSLHPFSMNQSELDNFLKTQNHHNIKGKWNHQIIDLPTTPDNQPLFAIVNQEPTDIKIIPYTIEGLSLEPPNTLNFLATLPLGEQKYYTADLSFWVSIYWWSISLLARGKNLPGLETKPDQTIISKWYPVLDSRSDRQRLQKFLQTIPLPCRQYQSNARELELILSFIETAINTLTRQFNEKTHIPPQITSPHQEWLQSLIKTNSDQIIISDSPQLQRLDHQWKTWITPIQEHLTKPDLFRVNQYQTCFILTPPNKNQTDWKLHFALQSIDNPQIIIPSDIIWKNPVSQLNYQGKIINNPQETFLKGLGIAVKLYPLIIPTLEQTTPQHIILTAIQAYEFLKSTARILQENGLRVILPSSLQAKKSQLLGIQIIADTDQTTTKLGIENLLNFRWSLSIGGKTISKTQFNKLLAQNSPLVEIEGTWIELEPQSIKAAKEFFTTGKDQMKLTLQDALRIKTGDTQLISKLPIVQFETSGVLDNLLTNLFNTEAIEPITPTNFQGELRPYQTRGIGWLVFLAKWGLGGCLADDMGLGKTIQFLGFLLHIKNTESLSNPSLLICPTSVIGNWEREIKKFVPTLKIITHYGDKRAKNQTLIKQVQGIDLVITSYGLGYRDRDNLSKITWYCIVLDEAQNIKNHETKQSQAVRKLTAQFKLTLTGTPIENRLNDLWSIFDFINPGYLGTKTFFQTRFSKPIEKFSHQESLNTLKGLIQPFILRRLKSDRTIIQDLPDKQEINIFCGLSPIQAKLYQETVDNALIEINQAESIQRKGLILALLTKLKQICNHPQQYLKQPKISSNQESGKLNRLEEMLEEILTQQERILIFTQFAQWGKMLQPYLLEKHKWNSFFLYGSTSKKQREEMIERFQKDPDSPPIMILSLKAGGTGLNLTRANHVFHYDRWWNPAIENQASDRAFRIGQSRHVQIYKFVCIGTLEEKIHDMIESKKTLAQNIITTGENWLTELDTDQLRQLLILDRNAIIQDD